MTMMPLRTLFASAVSSSSPCLRPACSAIRSLSTATEDEERSYEAGSSGRTGGCSRKQSAEDMIRSVARSMLAAELAAMAFLKGQSQCRAPGGRERVDLKFFAEQEAPLVESAREQLLRHRARPSILQGALQAAGMTLGAVSAMAPRNISLAISGAVQDALTDHFTEHIRQLHESGADAADVRETLRGLRDAERAPDGAKPSPDLLAYSKMRSLSDLGTEGAVGAVVKAGMLGALGLALKL